MSSSVPWPMTLSVSWNIWTHPGQSPFGRLNPAAAAKVTIALYRLEHGNFSNVKGVGAGIYEYKIDFGPGYRIYFGKDGDRTIILLGGSDKKGRAVAILNAQAAWALYKKRNTKRGTN